MLYCNLKEDMKINLHWRLFVGKESVMAYFAETQQTAT